MSFLVRLVNRMLGPATASAFCKRELEPLAGPAHQLAKTREQQVLIIRGSIPRMYSFPEQVVKVVGGIDHLLFRSASGRLYGLWSNYYGQLGLDMHRPTPLWPRLDDDHDEWFDEPQRLETLDGLAECRVGDIAAGHFASFAVADGLLYGWGAGLLGNGQEHFDTRPQLARIRGACSVAAWQDLVAVTDAGGASYLFGSHLDSKYRVLRPCASPAQLSLPARTEEHPNTPIVYIGKQTWPHTQPFTPDFPIRPAKSAAPTSLHGFAQCYSNYNYAVYY